MMDVNTESIHTSLMTEHIHLAAIRLHSSSTDLRGSLQNDWGALHRLQFSLKAWCCMSELKTAVTPALQSGSSSEL